MLYLCEYSVRMEFGGIRKRLTLGTALKEEAALKARDIYLSLVAKGWSFFFKQALSNCLL